MIVYMAWTRLRGLGQHAYCRQCQCESVHGRDGNLGIRFQGGFADVFGGAGSDALSSYTVTSLGQPIIDVHLAGNPAVIGPDGAEDIVTVTETFIPDDDELVLTIFDFTPGEQKLVA